MQKSSHTDKRTIFIRTKDNDWLEHEDTVWNPLPQPVNLVPRQNWRLELARANASAKYIVFGANDI